MLDAWGDHPEVRACLKEASAALGEDLAALIHAGPKEQLALTANTQPVMLVAAIASWRAWRAAGGALPSVVAGHSLGEYSALVAAGALTLAQAVPLVRLRAAAMQEAVPVGTGAMAAILGLDASKVVEACRRITRELDGAGGEVVEAVNFNTPVQTVIAGTRAAVDRACAALKAEGAKRALMLPVSAPFHSSLMKPAAERLKSALAAVEFKTPEIPVVNNVDVAVETDPGRIRDALYRQAFSPVRWVETLHKIKAMGADLVIECGPGKVLAGTVARTDDALAAAALFDPATLAEASALLA
jgi:[acyl-carrier-protein] S-malonyltransferase